MRDLKRLLRYIKPHWQTFALATFAMFLVGLLEIAIGSLVVPIFDQALAHGGGARTQTLFGLQNLIPESGLAAWRTIALLLLAFTLGFCRLDDATMKRVSQDLQQRHTDRPG